MAIQIRSLMTRAPLALGLCFVMCAAPARAQSDPGQPPLESSADPGAAGQTPTPPVPTAANTQIRSPYWASNIGFEGDTHNTGYGFAGPQYVHPFRPMLSAVAGGNVNYLWYSFQNSFGRTTSVQSPGLNVDGGLRVGSSNWAQFTLGPGFKNRHMKIEDAADNKLSSDSDMRWGMHYGASVYLNPSRRNNVFGMWHYGAEDQYTWSALRFKQQVSNYNWQGRMTHYLGAEIVGQGNDDIHSFQFGPTFEFLHVPTTTSIFVGTGWKHSWFPIGPDKDGAFFTIGVWRRM